MSDKIFAEGAYFERRENAPEFVVGRLGIDVRRFVAWLEKQPVSEKGYLNLNIAQGRNGKHYVELDTWKPTQSKPAQPQGGDYNDDLGIPF
jgi:hypothetical protein